jgi:hypothetical protein
MCHCQTLQWTAAQCRLPAQQAALPCAGHALLLLPLLLLLLLRQVLLHQVTGS